MYPANYENCCEGDTSEGSGEAISYFDCLIQTKHISRMGWLEARKEKITGLVQQGCRAAPVRDGIGRPGSERENLPRVVFSVRNGKINK